MLLGWPTSSSTAKPVSNLYGIEDLQRQISCWFTPLSTIPQPEQNKPFISWHKMEVQPDYRLDEAVQSWTTASFLHTATGGKLDQCFLYFNATVKKPQHLNNKPNTWIHYGIFISLMGGFKQANSGLNRPMCQKQQTVPTLAETIYPHCQVMDNSQVQNTLQDTFKGNQSTYKSWFHMINLCGKYKHPQQKQQII